MLFRSARSLQPGIIVDDRLDLKDVEGGWDFVSPEQVKVSNGLNIMVKRYHGRHARHFQDHGVTTATSIHGKATHSYSNFLLNQ